jgi:ABC-type sugar transport system permease subunit
MSFLEQSMHIRNLILRLIFLGIFDAIALQMALSLGRAIGVPLGIGIAVYAIIVTIVFLRRELFPWRWILPALAGMVLLILYPIGYSFIVAFTNYGDGHLLSKEQVIAQRLRETFAPADAPQFDVYIYRNDTENTFRYWLIDQQGRGFIHDPAAGGMIEVAAEDSSYDARDENNVPLRITNFNRLPAGGALRFSQTIQEVLIDAPPYQIRFTRLGLGEVQQADAVLYRWTYDAITDTLTDNENNEIYTVERGNFVTGSGENRKILEPGFASFIGFDNITRVITDRNVRDPFWRVFLWSIVFAGGSVLLTFTLGLALALALNSRDVPLRTLFRSILIIPYAVPGWLLVTTWRGLLNPVYGPVNIAIASLIGVSPQWFADPSLAKVGVLFVNMYLGFPYMMLISLGVLQSISADMYEAATIDGATAWQQFKSITLPLLLVAMAPLLVASYAFNFNNFTVIELFNNGGPSISAGTVAGHTDVLLSYTYRLAFGGAAGTDYGFAAAIGIFIFIIVGTLTTFNFRLTRRFEEIGANA